MNDMPFTELYPSSGPQETRTCGAMTKSGQEALRMILILSDKALVAAWAQQEPKMII